jgi:hypothetical protein
LKGCKCFCAATSPGNASTNSTETDDANDTISAQLFQLVKTFATDVAELKAQNASLVSEVKILRRLLDKPANSTARNSNKILSQVHQKSVLPMFSSNHACLSRRSDSVKKGKQIAISSQKDQRNPSQAKRNEIRRLIIGTNKSSSIKSVPPAEKPARVFVSRFEQSTDGKQLHTFVLDKTNIDCRVFKMKTRFDTYSSFVFELPEFYSGCLLSPDLWPEGILVKRYRGKFTESLTEEIDYKDD